MIDSAIDELIASTSEQYAAYVALAEVSAASLSYVQTPEFYAPVPGPLTLTIQS